jgi:CDP-paratose 2-epimerase
MSIDASTHSLFGVSKTAADLLVQEYGRYFGMNTVCFRGGCLTGSGQSAAMLHGFLAYLMRCVLRGRPYTIYGYGGKQVRDHLHASDLAGMFWHFSRDPRPGEVYNVGGGRHCNCSVLEGIRLCEAVAGRKLDVRYSETPRIGDHKWWISDVGKFRNHYPEWTYRHDLNTIAEELHRGIRQRL